MYLGWHEGPPKQIPAAATPATRKEDAQIAAAVHDALIDIYQAVWKQEAWARTEDRIDALVEADRLMHPRRDR